MIDDAMKQKLDGKTIKQIENFAANENKKSVEHRRQFIETLYYLRKTKRYRENPVYKNAGFSTYISGVFMMNETAFENERRAYVIYPEQSKKLGPGVVSKAIKVCGLRGAEKPLETIMSMPKADAKTASDLIEASRPKRDVEFIAKSPTKSELRKEIEEHLQTIHAQAEEIDELTEQVNRLKKTVIAKNEIIKELEFKLTGLRKPYKDSFNISARPV
jgi:hypothetical protein